MSLFDEYVVITDKLSDIIKKVDESNNNYIFELYGDENVIFEQNIAEELRQKAIEKDIRISVFTPFDKELKGYQRQLVDVTGGMIGNGFDEFTDKNIYEYVFGEKYVAKEYLPVILATGYQKIVLDTLLYPNGKNPSGVDTDTDKDGVSDWDEVYNELLIWDEDEHYSLPKVCECVQQLKRVPFYVENAFTKNRLMGNYGSCEVLPIRSNPICADTDDDGYDDEQDLAPLTPFVNPIMLLHGRVSNTYDTFGVPTNVCPKADESYNNHYNAFETTRIYDDGNTDSYTSINTHIINSQNIVGGKLGDTLCKKGYEANKGISKNRFEKGKSVGCVGC